MSFGSVREIPILERLREADELVRCEDTSRALARLNRVETQHLSEEERLRVLLLRCWVHLEEQDLERLEKCLGQAFQLSRDDLELRLLRAHYFAHAGMEREAVREAASVARVSKLEEHHARAYLIIGLALYRTRHFHWAIRISEKSEAFYNWNGNILLASWAAINLGLCHKSLAQCNLALGLIRRVSRSLPSVGYEKTRFRARLNEGVVLLLLGEIPLARAAFIQAMKSESEASPLHNCLTLNNLGHTYRMQGDAQRALEYYAQAGKTASDHHLEREHCISLFWSGQSYLESGKLSEAERSLEEAESIAVRMKHGGLRLEVLRRRADLLWKRGKRRLARQLVSKTTHLRKSLSQPRDRALLKRTELIVSTEAASDEVLKKLIRDFQRTGDRYEYTHTVLLLFENLVRDRHRRGWLEGIEMEARYYIATIGREDWQRRLDAALLKATAWPRTPDDFDRNRRAFERAEIEAALTQVAGVTNSAAGLLGIGRNTLAKKIKEYDIDRKMFRPQSLRNRSRKSEGLAPLPGRQPANGSEQDPA